MYVARVDAIRCQSSDYIYLYLYMYIFFADEVERGQVGPKTGNAESLTRDKMSTRHATHCADREDRKEVTARVNLFPNTNLHYAHKLTYL